MALQKPRVTKNSLNPYHMYTITYLARVETNGVQLYTSKGVLTHAIRKTQLIERDCVIVSRSIAEAQTHIEEMDDCFVRLLTSNLVPFNTVVHVLDRPTNYVDKV